MEQDSHSRASRTGDCLCQVTYILAQCRTTDERPVNNDPNMSIVLKCFNHIIFCNEFSNYALGEELCFLAVIHGHMNSYF